MYKVLIIGSGPLATAAVKMLHQVGQFDLVVVGEDTTEIQEAVSHLNANVSFVATTWASIDRVVSTTKPDVILSVSPVAGRLLPATAIKHGAHLIDTSSTHTNVFEQLDTGYLSFFPQIGLAPGLTTLLGHFTTKEISNPTMLKLRAGALPVAAFEPSYHVSTTSIEELIHSYMYSGVKLHNGIIQPSPALDEVEVMHVAGETFEAFTTSAGIGNACVFGDIPNVDFKVMRHVGHLDYAQKVISRVGDPEDLPDAFKKSFGTTRDDRVLLVAQASNDGGETAISCVKINSLKPYGLSATEIATLVLPVAAVELLNRGSHLPNGVLSAVDLAEYVHTTNASKTYLYPQTAINTLA